MFGKLIEKISEIKNASSPSQFLIVGMALTFLMIWKIVPSDIDDATKIVLLSLFCLLFTICLCTGIYLSLKKPTDLTVTNVSHTNQLIIQLTREIYTDSDTKEKFLSDNKKALTTLPIDLLPQKGLLEIPKEDNKKEKE